MKLALIWDSFLQSKIQKRFQFLMTSRQVVIFKLKVITHYKPTIYFRRLQDRIKQHVRQWLRQQLTRPRQSQPHRSCKRTDTTPDCGSAIGQHLLDNDQCALNYDNKRFSILAAARSSFHLNLLEAAYIKTRRPVLCRQKEFVYTLKLFR